MNLHDLEIHCSVLMVENYREEKRVKGGYMNRWLIRKIESGTRPLSSVYRTGNCIYMHPTMLEKLNQALKEQGQPELREHKGPATDYVRSIISHSMLVA